MFAWSDQRVSHIISLFLNLLEDLRTIYASSRCVSLKRRSARPTAETARVGGHYAVQGHSRSLISVPIESPYATSYQWMILYIRAPFTRYRAGLNRGTSSVQGIRSQKPLRISPWVILLKTRFHYFYRRQYGSIFNHFDVIGPQSCLS